MKIKNTGYLASVLCLAFIILFTACSEEDPAPSEAVLSKLKSKTWDISSVQVDGVDQTSLFAGMTLTFTVKDYQVNPANAIWPASGTWQFTDKEGTVIKRNDGLEITVTEITGSSLKLSLQWSKNTFGAGRITSVSGQHLFTFN